MADLIPLLREWGAAGVLIVALVIMLKDRAKTTVSFTTELDKISRDCHENHKQMMASYERALEIQQQGWERAFKELHEGQRELARTVESLADKVDRIRNQET